jgi:hypothetical protein
MLSVASALDDSGSEQNTGNAIFFGSRVWPAIIQRRRS